MIDKNTVNSYWSSPKVGKAGGVLGWVSHELACEAHKSTRTASLVLHVHRQGHLGSAVDRGLLVGSRRDLSLALLLIEKLAGLTHRHANELVLRALALTLTLTTSHAAATCEHLTAHVSKGQDVLWTW